MVGVVSMVREDGAGLKHQDELEGPDELQFAHITEPSRRRDAQKFFAACIAGDVGYANSAHDDF